MILCESPNFADRDPLQTPNPQPAATPLHQHVPWLPGKRQSGGLQEFPLQTNHLLVTPQTHFVLA